MFSFQDLFPVCPGDQLLDTEEQRVVEVTEVSLIREDERVSGRRIQACFREDEEESTLTIHEPELQTAGEATLQVGDREDFFRRFWLL